MFPTSQYMGTDQMYGPVAGAAVAPSALSPGAALSGNLGGSGTYKAAFSTSGSALALVALLAVCLIIYHAQ